MAETATKLLFLVFVYCFLGVELVFAHTHPQDAAALVSLKDQWENVPPSWETIEDPCGAILWEGVTCNNSRVISLKLSSMNLKGALTGDIGQLSLLQILDLSQNKGLAGDISPGIGNLKELNILILTGCSFTGSIPAEIGHLYKLSFLSLNLNKFSGEIPASLGNLKNLYWLDVADNELYGTLPVSSATTPGLDQLINAKHFHFSNNILSGVISEGLFNDKMVLLHVLLDGNKLTGGIPKSLGDVQYLEVLRLDRNSLSGAFPSNLTALTRLRELNLANNQLVGPFPNLTEMKALSYVDMSNNTFDISTAPTWFSTLQSLTTLILETVYLNGTVPQTLFKLPLLQQVKLRGNQFKDLDMDTSIGPQLQLVDIQDNQITIFHPSSEYNHSLLLKGNQVCADKPDEDYCKPQELQLVKSYSTSLASCGIKVCESNKMKVDPQDCVCALPFSGIMYFRAPFFRDLSNATVFHELETSLWTKLELTPGSVFLQNPFLNSLDYIQIELYLFPTNGSYFNRTEIQRLGFYISNHTFKQPYYFGPYYFTASPYDFQDGKSGTSKRKDGTSASLILILGIASGCVLLIVILVLVGIYVVRRMKKADRTTENSKSLDFAASWDPTDKHRQDSPQLKGARWFSFGELKKCTNNFLDGNEVGSGGYGKVYRGMLSSGQVVAVKRAQHGSMQGGLEFKTEIELLSRVHHKNLVSLLGFCSEHGEQMLVYEFITNMSLRDSLAGRSGIYLDWKRRLHIAQGSARGLAYLHEHANPPIIHRDVKSTNILLDDHLTAKIADFGLSKLVQDPTRVHVTTQVKGTMGYLDPEYYMTNQLTEKSDVYSFGVVMLEIVTSKTPIDTGKYIVREVLLKLDKDKQHYGLEELMDPTLRNEASLVGFGRFIELAVQCVAESAADRPTMSDVVKEIEAILHYDKLNTNSPSPSSSAIDSTSFGGSHPYNDVFPRKNVTKKGLFDYSGDYSHATDVEPK